MKPCVVPGRFTVKTRFAPSADGAASSPRERTMDNRQKTKAFVQRPLSSIPPCLCPLSVVLRPYLPLGITILKNSLVLPAAGVIVTLPVVRSISTRLGSTGPNSLPSTSTAWM